MGQPPRENIPCRHRLPRWPALNRNDARHSCLSFLAAPSNRLTDLLINVPAVRITRREDEIEGRVRDEYEERRSQMIEEKQREKKRVK